MDGNFLELENYGIVGNQETCALIGSNGSVDWLTEPFLDSPSVFAALLDPDRGGLFSITPLLKFDSIQRYRQDSNVLVTEFTTATGEAAITDFMPPLEACAEPKILLRLIEGRAREATFGITFRPRFDYGRQTPTLAGDGEKVVASTEQSSLHLFGGGLSVSDGEASATITVSEGEKVWLLLMWGEAPKPPAAGECERLLERTLQFWRDWSATRDRSESVHSELSHSLAIRSGLALKLLLNPKTGGIAAAATLALPECVGGVRNWDYRFAWIRDASFTAQALFHLGYQHDAAQYRRWIMGLLRSSDDLSKIHPLYPLHEAAQTEEGMVQSLCGYRHSAPVLVGNLAAKQTQLDLYGEIVNTVFETGRYGEEIDAPVWTSVRNICNYISRNWREKDRGIWEMRTPPKDYVHSKLMCWVALDRATRMAEHHHLDAPLEQWSKSRDEVREAILRHGYSARLRCFVQSFDSEDLDATALLIPIHRFLPPEDPRVQSTIDVIRERLSAGHGLLYRYNSDDGLAGSEGAFVLCSFWLVIALAVSRRTEEADQVFQEMLQHVGPLGLFSEEVDPRDGRLIGNFPQALSQIGLINAALHLGIAKGRAHQGPAPQSERQ